MINFSRVMKSLREEEYIFEAVGDQGFNIEHKVAEHLMPKVHKPGGEFVHVDADTGKSNTAAKTDFYEKRSHKGQPDVGYSVKSKGDNDEPMKIHQTSAGNPAGLFSKLKSYTDVKNNYGDQIGDSKIKQALVMAFGSHMGTLSQAAGTQLFPDLTDDQRNILRTKSKKGQYLTPKEMKETFGGHHDALLKHLERNKSEIFKALVRQHGSPSFGTKPYEDHDPQPVSKLIQHRRDAGTAPGDTSGRIDIHDISKDVFKDMKWFSDDERFYMSNEETDDIDKRLLDLYPITEENSKWTMRPGDGQGPRRGDRGYKEGVREHGIPEPGQFKATMGTNPQWLDKIFSAEASYQMKDRGQMDPTFTRIQDSQPESTPEPTPESTPSPETYADGTPKDDIPDDASQKQGGRFGNFMKKAGDIANKVLDAGTDGLQAGVDGIENAADFVGKEINKRIEPKNDGPRFRVLDDGRILDTEVGKKFQPRSGKNRSWAATMAREGNTELADILRRIDASESNK